jgi:hypothetical protein
VTHDLAKRIVESWGDDHDAASMMEVRTGYPSGDLSGRTWTGVACRDWPDFVAAVAMMMAEEASGRHSVVYSVDLSDIARELRNLRADGMGSQIIIY